MCGGDLGEEGFALLVRGRRVPLDPGCLPAFLADMEKYFVRHQPRGALFQEELAVPRGLGWGWFLLGLYILAGLVFGALCAHGALLRGFQPVPWFIAGLAFSIPAYCLLRARPAREKVAPPAGLAKIPVTRQPVRCPDCGGENHPAARRCLGCGASLTPIAESEIERVR